MKIYRFFEVNVGSQMLACAANAEIAWKLQTNNKTLLQSFFKARRGRC